jgi:hypothetical protein
MSAIVKADIKTLMGILSTETKYDTMIDDIINFAYSFLDNYIAFDKTSDKYSEYNTLYDELYILVSANKKDIILTAVTVDDDALVIATDLKKITYQKWEIINEDYEGEYDYFIEYTSVNLTASVNKLLREIIIFEMNKFPAFENLINKKASEFEKDQELKNGKFKKGGSLSPTKKSVGKTIGKLNKAKSGSKVSKKKK